MQALSEWVGNIVILILIAVIMDMLVPNNSLHQYVKMVIGLLLILLLLSPLLSIFSSDKDKIFESIKFEQAISENVFEKKMNHKKNEIQATQDAYIEEQMAVQMKNQVEEELMEQYEVSVEKIRINFKEKSDRTYENILGLQVFLTTNKENQVKNVEPVEVVTIGEEQSFTLKERGKTNEIRKFLAKQWGIDEEKVTVEMAGREREKL
ncbi:stage III sporulation protein AF [Pueribacillus theae]|uniref:stage III sporulation protein AF n=1 Tax=Pueribacillus theae TaxID=2171751 RepID=UPI001401EB93|nr:stage III sporulation protein AF [Pueribacillus theae]